MAQMIVIVGTVSLLAAIIGATIASKIQYNYLNRTQEQLLAWERAQESHQRHWETQQEKRIAEIRYDLTELVGKVQYDWEAWQLKDKERIEQFNEQFEETEAQMHLKRELARLPRVEDAHLILDEHHQHRIEFPNWQPPMLQGANLSDQDFSHRYFGQADLRKAQLMRTNFYMADLTDACLPGANLSEAALTGTNLSGADLRGANLNGANLLVADLHHAILIGANLLGARNLTKQQLETTIYDESTLVNIGDELPIPRSYGIQPVLSSPLPQGNSLLDLELADLLVNSQKPSQDAPGLSHGEE
jgi:Pentapeptide repeats (8 copies)